MCLTFAANLLVTHAQCTLCIHQFKSQNIYVKAYLAVYVHDYEAINICYSIGFHFDNMYCNAGR